MPDFLNGLFFSEILADNAGGAAVDVNGQGGANKQDEFIEFQNNSSTTIDLDGYQIWSDKNGLLHTFGPGDQIAPGDTATVVGTYNNAPSGFYGANGANNSAQGNGGFLEDGEGNKFDTIYLVDPSGNYIQLSYGNPPRDPQGLPPGFPSGGSLQGAGEVLNSSAPNGTSVLRDADGNLVEGTPTPGTPGPVCFVSGTLITCDNGDVAVDALAPGARILSKDNGYVPLRAVGSTPVSATALALRPDIRAVRIPARVLGNPQPLRLSPAHRVLLSGPTIELLMGETEVLVAARQLVGHMGIHVEAPQRSLIYFHLLFDGHEVIRSNCTWSESLFLGKTAHRTLLSETGWRVQGGLEIRGMSHRKTARPVLRGHEARLLAAGLAETREGSRKVLAARPILSGHAPPSAVAALSGGLPATRAPSGVARAAQAGQMP